MQKPNTGGIAVATDADIISILGNIDSDQLLAILSLRARQSPRSRKPRCGFPVTLMWSAPMSQSKAMRRTS